MTALSLVPLALGLIISDAHIVTLDAAHPVARHAAVQDGRFSYVGDDLVLARKAAGKGARELDALGATVVPGFNDAHVHFGLSMTIGAEDALDLREEAEDRAAFTRAITQAAARPVARGAHDWIFVTARTLPPGVRTGSDLPGIARPLFVITEHGGLMNPLGLSRCKLGAADAPEGHIRGRLLPAALDRVVKSLPREVLFAGARRFLAELARLGLTSVQLMDELPEIFEALRRDGDLTARVRLMVFGYRFETPRYVPSFRPVDPSWVQLDAVKYFHDDWARLPRAELKHIYEEAQGTGRPVVLHVLSRAALRSLLDQLERQEALLPGGARLFRIDHADEVTPELAARLARLGITVCPNPAMLPEWQSERAFPMRTLLDAGVTTCIGSDWVGKHQPARPLSPLFGLRMAVTHGGYGERERISIEEALTAYTQGSALAEGSSELGVIRAGALADLVGLSGDPTRIPPEQLDQLRVRFTIVGGRVVYERRPPPLMQPASMPPPGSRPGTKR